MKKSFFYPLVFVFLIVGIYLIHLSPCPGGAIAREAIASTLDKSEVSIRIQKLSIPFILNQGQVDKRVKFYANTFGGTVFVTEKGEIVYSLQKTERDRKALKQKGKVLKPDSKTIRGWALKEELVGGRLKEVKAEEEAITKVSHFTGNDSSKWKTNIPTYGLVSLGEAYEGIEVKLKAYGRKVEKLFYVRAGADPNSIRLRLNGGESLRVNEEGALEIKIALGDIKFSKPVAYQELDGRRVDVAVDYHLLNSELRTPNSESSPLDSKLITPNSELVYSFKIGDYDRTKTLVIDPILQSTYLGGSGHETPYALALDSSGNVYVAGITTSTNFPGTTGGAQPSYGGGNHDIFLSKLNSALTSILQSTYLGGSGDEDYQYGNPSIAIDSSGNVYVAGLTSSTNFPGTTGGAQPSYGGGERDAFVSKFNSALTSILQSTYLGGSGFDGSLSIAIDSSGNVYMAGLTSSTNLPGTTGGAQPSYGGGDYDGFITKLNSALTSMLQSTYLGGSGDDGALSIAIDSSGNVYVGGVTNSTNFPGTTGGAQPSSGGDYDAFVTKLNSSLTSILQSTYLGGSGEDSYNTGGIAIDSAGNVYVVNKTSSTDFPGTTGGAQPSYAGGNYDAFVSKLNSALTSILQSTYLGGSGNEDWGYSIALDSSGNVYVVGNTSSNDFPGTTGGAQPSYGGGDYDGFVTKLNSALTSILQSTYLGGSYYDCALSIAVDSAGNVYVAGQTESTNFPGTTGGAQPSYGGGEDAFIAKLDSRLAAILFSDVPSDYWACDYIRSIYNAGITRGCAQDDPNTPENERRYCPEDSVTRGQMAAFIIRAKYGENFSYTTTPYFTDVPSTHTFFKYVQKLRDDGITVVSGTYSVDSYVSRGQMAAFIIRAKFGENFTYTTTPYFSDVPSTHNFFKYVQKMKDEGITTVTGTYNVDSIVTRAQMAAFLARAFLGTATAILEFPFSNPENVVRMAAWGVPNWSGTEPHNGIDLEISESLPSAKIISPTAGEVTSVTTSENPFSNPPGQLILSIAIRVNDEWNVNLCLEPGTTDPALKSAQLAAVRVSPGQDVSVGTHVADLLVGTLGYPTLHYMVSRGDQNVCAYKYSSGVAKSTFDEIAATRPNNYLPDGNICYGQP
jgi:hypothetical protein